MLDDYKRKQIFLSLALV